MPEGTNAYAEMPATQRIYTEARAVTHQPFLVAMDVSGSMDHTEPGEAKKNFQLAEEMVNQIGKDPELEGYKRTIDVCIMTFADQVETVCDWQPLSQYRGGLNFSAAGRTAFHDVVKQSINAVRAMKDSYAVQGVPCKRPQIFIITDGYSTDPEDNPDVVNEAMELCQKYVDKKGHIAMHVILLPGGTTKDAKGLANAIKLYKVEDCAYGLPAVGQFINASIVNFSSAGLGATVKTEVPKGMKTTQAVQKDGEGHRFVSETVETWN